MRNAFAAVCLSLAAASTLAQTPASTDKDREIALLKRQVATLQAQVKTLRADQSGRASMQEQMAAMQKHVAALDRAVKGLQANSILDLNGYLTLDLTSGYPTALFRGLNVQVVNGTGNTQTANGVGNLIVGYNRPRTASAVCSIGALTTDTECNAQGGVWSANHKSGSHNIVGGDFNAYSMWGGLVMGIENVINAPYASVTAGSSNVASGDLASVTGGSFNTSNAMYGSVSGGLSNMAAAPFSSVSGGSVRKTERSYNWKAGNLSQEQ